MVPNNTKVFLRRYAGKADLSKGGWNPIRKLGVTTPFLEIAELKFGKTMPYIVKNFKAF